MDLLPGILGPKESPKPGATSKPAGGLLDALPKL
jgi:hypothetical protein